MIAHTTQPVTPSSRPRAAAAAAVLDLLAGERGPEGAAAALDANQATMQAQLRSAEAGQRAAGEAGAGHGSLS
jgi:hypothetical protein